MFRLLTLLLSLYAPPPDLQSCVRFWQRELFLDQWTITVQMVNRAQLNDGTLGEIDADPERRTAVIYVVREEDYDLPLRQARADQQLTIAHEMVHLDRLARFPFRNDWQDEPSTVAQTFTLLRKHHRWRELSVAEP